MPRFYRHKLLLDEGFPYRTKLPRVNSRYDLKHIKGDLGRSGLSDNKVYEIAEKMGRLLIIFNIKDYKKLARKSSKTGIIGISQNLSTEQIDKKLTALLAKSGPRQLYGRFTPITGETE